ncbi:MAG: TetR/AcrR family transcriptional regulator [Nitrospirae bacterium]|nr:TetR/AcrR family transcriptional regulator [Nitrospirota bacterium]
MDRPAHVPETWVVRPPRRSRAQQAAETVQAIIRAALVCFNRNGSQATSIENIAQEAGVSRTLVHYHFRTKDDLFMEVQHRLFEAVSERVRETVGRLGPSAAHAGWALDEIWNLMKQGSPFLLTFVDQMARSGRDETLKGQFRGLVDANRKLLVEGIRTVLGTPGTAADARVPGLATLIISALTGLYMLTMYTGVEEADAAYHEFRRLLVGAAPEVSGVQAGQAPLAGRSNGE